MSGDVTLSLTDAAVSLTVSPDQSINLAVIDQPVILSLGTAGPQGPAGTKQSYTFPQNSPSAVWTINHNLNAFPAVTVIDSGGSECEGLIHYVDNNNLTITFSAAFSGIAYLN